MGTDTRTSVGAAASALTGLIRAFELHADANPDLATLLRSDADTLRGVRDRLLDVIGEPPGTDVVKYGADREWAVAISRLTEGSNAWPFAPSRSPWSPGEV